MSTDESNNTQGITDIDKENSCRVSFDNGCNWTNGIITEMNDKKNIAKIFITTGMFNKYFTSNSKIFIKFLKNGVETVLYGHIKANLSSIHTRVLSIKINKKLDYKDIRKHTRFPVNFECAVSQMGKVLPAKLEDISMGGAKISSVHSLETPEAIQIDILVDDDKKISFTGNIVRRITTINGFQYGIEIKEIDEKNKEVLDGFLTYINLLRLKIYREQKIINIIRAIVYVIVTILIYKLILVGNSN